jgi:hypothetical protein
MTARPVPRRHWRSYGNDPLPSGALDEPLRAFSSWFLRIVCDRCGKERIISETHMAQGEMRNPIERMRHDGCGGRAGKVELLTGLEGASSRPVRRIVLQGESGKDQRHEAAAASKTLALWGRPHTRLVPLFADQSVRAGEGAPCSLVCSATVQEAADGGLNERFDLFRFRHVAQTEQTLHLEAA